MRVANRHKEPFGPTSVYIGRGSPLGNPYTHKGSRQDPMIKATRQEAIEAYEGWLREAIAAGDTKVLQALDALPEDAVLMCYCAPLACHGEVVIKVWRERRLGSDQPTEARK
jgi:hypothetical protein